MIHSKIKTTIQSKLLLYLSIFTRLAILPIVKGAPGLVPPFHIHAPSSSPSPHPPPPSPPPSPRFPKASFKSLSFETTTTTNNNNKLPSPKPSSLKYNLDTGGLGAALDIFTSSHDDEFADFSSSSSSPLSFLSSYFVPRHLSSSTTNTTKNKESSSSSRRGEGPNWWVELKNPFQTYQKNEIPLNRRSGSSTVYQILHNDVQTNNNGEKGEKKKKGESQSNPPYGRHHHHRRHLSTTTNITLATTKDDDDNVKCEYMIISGGFTDDDWSTFPIWALDMTYANPLLLDDDDDDDNEEKKRNGAFLNGGNYYAPEKTPWVEITNSFIQTKQDGMEGEEEEEEKKEEGPMGRVGHVTSISSDGYFYVFGGLLYKEKTFNVEESPFVWRLKISDYLSTCRGDEMEEKESEEEEQVSAEEEEEEEEEKKVVKPLVWEKIRPMIVVDSLPSFYADFEELKKEDESEESKAIENGDSSENGEDQGDNTSQEEDVNGGNADENKAEEESKDNEDSNNKPPNRQRRTTWTMVGNNNNNNNDNNDDTTTQNTSHKNQINEAITYLDDPSIYLPRGEAQGGHWSTTNSLIIYGGLHVTEIPNPHHHSYMKTIQIDKTTGDVWLYQYDTETFYLLCSYPPPSWQRDGKTGKYPIARTSHAATIVNDELIVHGGMAMDEAHKNWDGTTSWDPLSDVWVFDLKKRVWRERIMVPELARSYHSLVGWGEGSVASFGGFRTAQTVGGEPIAFVFSDTIVSHPHNPQWLKASYPDHAQYTSNPSPTPSYFPAVTISNRLEHNAVLNKDGLMYVWGGRFKSVDQISGTWMLNVFGSNTAVSFEEAIPDGLEAYEAELEALHLLVGIMLFMSIMFTALYGTLRRQTEEHMNNGGNGGGTIFARSRRGLSREAIDALPVKTYNRSAAKAASVGASATVASMPDGDTNESEDVLDRGNGEEENFNDVGLENEPSMTTTTTEGSTELPSSPLGAEVEEEEEETCPICLVEYEDGDEVRQLPCGHEFHVDCIDSWLEAHTSCPSCRNELSNSVGSSNRSSEGRNSMSARQATNLMLGLDDDDMFFADVIRSGLIGYVRDTERREEGEGGEGDNIDRSGHEQPSMFPLVPSMSLARFLAGPESGWFFHQHERRNHGDVSAENEGPAGGETTNETEQDEHAEQEYIPREHNPEERRASRSRLSNLGIPRRLQRRRRGGATEMVTIRRHDNSSEEDPELTIV